MSRQLSPRQLLLAKVHIAKKDLGLDDPTYRLLLERVTGHESAADCSDGELDTFLKELRVRGWRDRQSRRTRRPQVGEDLTPMMGKIGALLADAGRPWTYAQTLARRIAKVDRLEWANAQGLRGVITALERDARRRRERSQTQAEQQTQEVSDAGT